MTNNKQHEKSSFLLSLASYVGGIREGWRRMRGDAAKKTEITAGEVLGASERREGGWREAREVAHVTHRTRGSQTSFEKFLRTLPRVDAVDRTVDWVLAQPDIIEERESERSANLPSNRLSRLLGHRRPLQPTLISDNTGHHLSDCHYDEGRMSSVSWSRYESERGTVGRGTPPLQREDRPRLDQLLQHIHRHQERRAVVEMEHVGQRSSGDGCACEGVRVVCGWGECRATLSSRRQLMAHITQHITSARLAGEEGQKVWRCCWRGCGLLDLRGWSTRLALQHHIFRTHCQLNDAAIKSKEVGVASHHNHNHHRGSEGHVIHESSTHCVPLTGAHRLHHISTARRTANQKMTMVTGLQIRPALVARNNERKGAKK